MKSWILSRYLTWIFIATSAICGCGGQDSTLIVTLGGLSSDLQSLHVVAQLGDRISDKTYRAAPVFGLRLPPMPARQHAGHGVRPLPLTRACAPRGTARPS